MMNFRLCIAKPNTVIIMKGRREEWAGHVVRMSEGRAVKKVFVRKPDGTRKAGIPKLRRLHCTEIDLKSVGVKRWRKNAEDRSVRASILKEAL
jgi:hypothetical protein